MEFKGTKGKLEKVYLGDVCIGIGVRLADNYHEMIANSVLPDVEDMEDDEVDRAMQVVEADMTLYSESLNMLETLKSVLASEHLKGTILESNVKKAIQRATNI